MQLVSSSKITHATFDFNKHLTIGSYRTLPRAILANIFLVAQILLLTREINCKICISYRTIPSTIWPLFSEFLIFCRLISRAFRRVK